MTDFAADDFASIARRMREIAGGDDAGTISRIWPGTTWCNHCGEARQQSEAVLIGTQLCCSTCLSCLIDYCETCCGGGWTMYSLPGGRGASFRTCDDCGNPLGNLSP